MSLQNNLLAEVETEGGLRRPADSDPKKLAHGLTAKQVGKQQRAGERLAGMADRASSLSIAAGAVGQGKSASRDRTAFDIGLFNSSTRTASVAGGSSSKSSAAGRVWRSPFWEGGWKDAIKERPSQAS